MFNTTREFQTIEPTELAYKFNLTGKYSLNIIDDKAPFKISEKMALRKIKEDNTTEISYTLPFTSIESL
jgi:hypothetical protein